MTSEPGETGQAAAADTTSVAAVEVRAVTKTYGTVTALDQVDFTLRRGTVHALVGENGSGKSTLTKIIAGVEQPDSGDVGFGGEFIPGVDPREAIRRGVRVIFQDLALFPNMSVAENLAFEGDRPLLRVAGRAGAKRHAQRALDALDLKLPLDVPLGELSTAERQLVAIARTVSSAAQIILMDEPTASLTQSEIDRLLTVVRQLSDTGLSFLFISHKLREVVEIADDVTVIRDGQVVSTGPAGEYDADRISELMTGGVVDNRRRTAQPAADEEPILRVSGLTLGSTFRDVDLEMYAGRVVGLAGLVGSGRIEMGLSIVGLVTADRGEVWYRGQKVRNRRRRRTLQYVPDDRLTEGLLLEWSIADNIVMNDLDSTLGRARTVSARRITEIGERWRERLRIKAPDATTPVSSLSGGNQQRVLLARALAPHPDVVVLNNPTVGVDVGSRADIHNLIRSEADGGTAILLISDEPAELLSVCDDVLLVDSGRIVGSYDVEEMDEAKLISLISTGGAA